GVFDAIGIAFGTDDLAAPLKLHRDHSMSHADVRVVAAAERNDVADAQVKQADRLYGDHRAERDRGFHAPAIDRVDLPAEKKGRQNERGAQDGDGEQPTEQAVGDAQNALAVSPHPRLLRAGRHGRGLYFDNHWKFGYA